MTEEQKNQIVAYRKNGYGYKQIATFTSLSLNTVKSFCRRNNLLAEHLQNDKNKYLPCEQCGKPVEQTEHKKLKRFCSDLCRNKWWNSHLDLVKRKANYEIVCLGCKKPFMVYGNANRKYCSHNCYVEQRFGGKDNE